MTINIPETSEEVIQRAKTDVRLSWVGSNPFLKNSAIAALTISFANRVFDFYLQLKEVVRQSFPDTATTIYLERWANIFGKPRLAATKGSGNLVATGVATTTIPFGTLFTTTNGIIYVSNSAVDIIANSNSVLSITRSGSTATATFVDPHGLSSNVDVTFSGADQSEYNITTKTTITGVKTLTYQVSGTPVTATGTLLADYDSVQVPVDSQEFSDSENDIFVNLDAETELKFQAPILNIDNEVLVDQGEISGGLDQEGDPNLRVRLLERIQDPVAHFNVSEITSIAKEINGVTRVFVEETTPLVGQVTIYFMRDLDDDPIPSAGEVTEVKNKILEIKPANTIDADVIVSAPVEVSTAFTFSALVPTGTAMQEAVENNLRQFFDEETTVGVDVTEEKYIAAIQNTIDADGNNVETFALSVPSGDITIASGEIATLGTVTFP